VPYTLGQAAKATGLSKPTISEAISKGRISAQKDESGRYQIDPAELHRVYPPLASLVSKEESQTEHFRTHDLTAKIMVLEAQVQALGELKDQIAAERDDLRTERDRLLSVIEEQAGSVKQLTHQPKPEPTVNQNDRPAIVRPWLLVALALAALLAAGVALYFWQQ
jgi:excisionase family DNA binding protein